MGEVWKAHDAKLRREVALKTLPPEPALNPAARLEREATSLAAVSHPNVAARATSDLYLVEGWSQPRVGRPL